MWTQGPLRAQFSCTAKEEMHKKAGSGKLTCKVEYAEKGN